MNTDLRKKKEKNEKFKKYFFNMMKNAGFGKTM